MSNHIKNHLSMVSLKAACARVLEYLPEHSVSMDKLEEWAYQIYSSLATREAHSINIGFVEIFNHKAQVPTMFDLEMVLFKEYDSLGITRTRTNPFSNEIADFETSTDIINGGTTDTTTKTTITTEVTGTNVKLNSGMNAPIYQGTPNSLLQVQIYHDTSLQATSWAPLPMSENVFHTSVLNGIEGAVHKNCGHSFVVQNGCFVTSFSEGSLMFAYTSLPTNSEGEYVYPDHEDVAKAIETGVMRNYWQWKWLTNSIEAAHNKYMHFAQLSEVLMPKASAHMMMPNLIEYQNLRNLNKFIKEDSPFATAMGAMGSSETMQFGNYPRYRNAYSVTTRGY